MRWTYRALALLIVTSAGAAESGWEQHFHRGDELERQGRYANAAVEFDAALAEAEHFAPTDWRLPLTLHNLGTVNRELGRNAQAERCYRRAISIWETHQPQRAVELSGSLQNLAALNLTLGRLSKAEPLYRRAYEIRRNVLGPEAALAGASLHGLAELLHQRRQFDESDRLYVQAVAILEAAHGPGSLDVADIAHNHALLYRDMRRDGDALLLLERAAAIYDLSAPQHPKLAIILRNLAELHASRGDFAKAAPLFERAVKTCDDALPPDHPQTGIILSAYARFLRQMHRDKEAGMVAERSRAILAKDRRETGTAYTVDVTALVAR